MNENEESLSQVIEIEDEHVNLKRKGRRPFHPLYSDFFCFYPDTFGRDNDNYPFSHWRIWNRHWRNWRKNFRDLRLDRVNAVWMDKERICLLKIDRADIGLKMSALFVNIFYIYAQSKNKTTDRCARIWNMEGYCGGERYIWYKNVNDLIEKVESM